MNWGTGFSACGEGDMPLAFMRHVLSRF
jgi:hypothetical protein